MLGTGTTKQLVWVAVSAVTWLFTFISSVTHMTSLHHHCVHCNTKRQTKQCTCVCCCRLNDWEVRDMLHRVEEDVQAAYRWSWQAVSDAVL